MTLTAKDSGGGDFKMISSGMHVARCVRIIDLGTQHNEMYGNDKRQVLICFETPNALIEEGEFEGKPCMVSKIYTLSIHEKSNLGQDLESWRGKAFTDAEREGFDLNKILDKACYVNVIHAKTAQGKDRAKISTINPLPKEITCPDRVNDLVVFDIDDWNQDTFDNFTDGVKKMINDSLEIKSKAEVESYPEADDPSEPEGTPF